MSMSTQIRLHPGGGVASGSAGVRVVVLGVGAREKNQITVFTLNCKKT